MAVVTIDGQIGSGAPEVGALVARRLEADYVDRLVLAEAAKRMGATVEAVEEKVQESATFMARLSRAFRTLLERSAMAGSGGDPYFGTGWENLLARPYAEEESEITSAQELDDQRFINTYRDVVADIAKGGNVVIVGHGASIILAEHPSALHVAVVASMDGRIARIMQRESLDRKAAEKYTIAQENARLSYYKRFLKVSARNPMFYHIVMNMSNVKDEYAAEVISNAAVKFEGGR